MRMWEDIIPQLELVFLAFSPIAIVYSLFMIHKKEKLNGPVIVILVIFVIWLGAIAFCHFTQVG